jgi:hypothetical protein
MPLVHHRTNPTRIQRIEKSAVSISLIRDEHAKPISFSVSKLDLAGKKLPPDAQVFVTVYSDVNELRHDLGSVAALKLGADLPLSLFDSASGLFFRIFVREPGEYRLLASCEGLQANRDGEDDQSLRSLLWIEYEDLGEELWQMRLSGGSRPILVLNDKHPMDLRAKIEARDPIIRALIVPHAIEQSLMYLALNDPPDSDDSHWQNEWLRSLPIYGAEEPPENVNEIADMQKVLDWARESAHKYATRIRLGAILANSAIVGDP